MCNNYIDINLTECKTRRRSRLGEREDKCSQASKVLGTTMDRRRTAWLDQAQWGPGQRHPPVGELHQPSPPEGDGCRTPSRTYLKMQERKPFFFF
jgi:hypothetical protein